MTGMCNLVPQTSRHKAHCKQPLATVCVHVCACLRFSKRLPVTGPKIGCFLIRPFPRHTSLSLLLLLLLGLWSLHGSFPSRLSHRPRNLSCFCLYLLGPGRGKSRYYSLDKDVSSSDCSPPFTLHLRWGRQTHRPTALGQCS